MTIKKRLFQVLFLLTTLSFFNSNSPYLEEPPSQQDEALIVAAKAGNVEGIKEAIKNGANVNRVFDGDCPHGEYTALQLAIESKSVEGVRLLLKAGANPNEFGEGGDIAGRERNAYPLALAISMYAPIEIIQELIKAHADVNKGDCTPLMIAALRGYTQAVKTLLSAGAYKDAINHSDHDRKAVHYALRNGNFAIAKMLIQPSRLLVPVHKIKAAIEATILGAAMGDALGKPTEFIYTIDNIKRRYPNLVKNFDDFKIEDFCFKNGKKIALYTDDTAMVKVALETLLSQLRYELSGKVFQDMETLRTQILPLDDTMAALAKAFVKDMNKSDGWYAPYREPGHSCKAGCRKLKEIIADKEINPLKYADKKWWRAGEKSAGGCGSVMRAYPFGLFFADDLEKAEQFAVEQSKLTHGADSAIAASGAMATGVAALLQGYDYRSAIEIMIFVANKYDSMTAMMIDDAYARAMINKKKHSTFEELFEASRPIFEKYLGWSGKDAIAATVYAFALFPDNLENALTLSVNTPGDSDSIGTMAGALVGAYSQKCPDKRFIDMLEDSDYLYDLASELSRPWSY